MYGARRRLARFKQELHLHITVDLREQVHQVMLEQLDRIEDLDLATKRIVDAITQASGRLSSGVQYTVRIDEDWVAR